MSTTDIAAGSHLGECDRIQKRPEDYRGANLLNYDHYMRTFYLHLEPRDFRLYMSWDNLLGAQYIKIVCCRLSIRPWTIGRYLARPCLTEVDSIFRGY